jgi:hypothetical protein
VALAAVFAAAAVPKILAPHDFAVAVFRYQIAPYALINGVALVLPWLELVTAVALLLPRFARPAALLMLAMLGVFTVALVAAVARGIDIACGCFSLKAGAAHMTWLNILRNLALLAMAAFCLRASRPVTVRSAFQG